MNSAGLEAAGRPEKAAAVCPRWQSATILLLGGAAAAATLAGWPVGRRAARVVVEMAVDRPAMGQVYYAVNDAPFREAASVRFDVIPQHRRTYGIDLPLERPERVWLRLDLSDQPGSTVTVYHVRFEFFCGLRRRVYELPAERWSAGVGLVIVKTDREGTEWRALDRDPQLPVKVEELPQYTFWRLTVALAGFVCVAAVIAVADRSLLTSPPDPAVAMIYAVGLGTLALQGFAFARRVPLGIPPDEWRHISVVMDLNETGRWVPDRWRRVEYSERGERTHVPLQLAHPAFYYHLCRPFLPRSPRQAVRHVAELRYLNLIMALAGVTLWFRLASRLPWPMTFHVFYVVALTSVPMVPYLAGAVNNDNLVLFAGALSFWGTLEFLDERPSPRSLPLMAAGLALALLTKLTAGMHVGVLVAIAALVRRRRDGDWRSLRGWPAAIAVLMLIGPWAVYLGLWLRYGSPVPFPADPSRIVRPAAYPELARFGRHFLWKLSLSWTGIFSHQHLLKRTALEAAPLQALPLLAVWGALRTRRSEERSGLLTPPAWRAALRCLLVATVVFGTIHLFQTYLTHLKTGYGGGIQARYYFSLMPGALMLAYRPFLGRERCLVVWGVLALLLLALLASGFYYWVLLPP